MSVLALLGLETPAAAEVPAAWGPWLALEGATAPDPSTSPRRTERLLGLGRAFLLHRRAHPDLARLVAEMEQRLSVLDAGSFYELLGRGHPGSQSARWFEVEGRWAGAQYPMKAWRKAPPPKAFGEARAHFGLEPATTPGGFVLKTELAGDLGDLRYEHVAAFIAALLSWFETARDQPEKELLLAFPRTAPLAQKYGDVRAEISPGEAGTRVRLHIALDAEAMQRDFPHIGRMLERLRGLADADIRVMQADAELARAVIDSKRLVTKLDFAVTEGKLVPMREGRRAGALIDLPSLTHLAYDVRSELRSNISGLEISVKELLVSTEFRRVDTRARWSAQLNRPPKVHAEGSFGIIPLWMVDAFIPSDVKTLATDFFRTMAEGNRGTGLTTQVDMPVGADGQRFFARVEGELLSNGFLTFCLRTVLSSLGDRDGLRRDMARLWARFLDAFEADFEDAMG